MVTRKGARKWWRKRRGYGFSFKRAISRYHYTKLSCNQRVELAASVCRFIPDNLSTITLANKLQDCPDWGKYKELFLSYKVLALAITAVPCESVSAITNSTTNTGTFPLTQTFFVGNPAIGLMAQGEGTSYDNIIESNKHIILNYTNTVRAYWKFDGGITSWDGTNSPSEQTGNIAVNIQGLPTFGSKIWTIQFDFYVMFKITV